MIDKARVRGMMLLIKSKQHVSKVSHSFLIADCFEKNFLTNFINFQDNISRIKLTPVNSADEDQVELLEQDIKAAEVKHSLEL